MGKQKKKGALDHLKETWDSTGTVRTFIEVLVTTGVGFLPTWLTTSATLRAVMIAGLVLGAVAAYFLTPVFWKGVAKKTRHRQFWRFGIWAIVAAALTVLLLVAMSPATAEQFEWYQDIHGFLVDTPMIVNSLAFLGLCAFGFCLVSGISVVSPKMQRGA